MLKYCACHILGDNQDIGKPWGQQSLPGRIAHGKKIYNLESSCMAMDQSQIKLFVYSLANVFNSPNLTSALHVSEPARGRQT